MGEQTESKAQKDAINNQDDNEVISNDIQLWTREETPCLTIPISYTVRHQEEEEEEGVESNDILLPPPKKDNDENSLINADKRPNSYPLLRIRQRLSSDDAWDIHSSVWDGGIGLLSYLAAAASDNHNSNNNVGGGCCDANNSHRKNTCLIDVGSGTGVVGIGMALVDNNNSSNKFEVYLTDLPGNAVSLLQDNVELNKSSLKCLPYVVPLPWGTTGNTHVDDDDDDDVVLPEEIQKGIKEASHVIVTGGDIIYSPDLFDPLLVTLEALWNYSSPPKNNNENKSFQIFLGSLSTFAHLDEFWDRARSAGWNVILKANVTVPQWDGHNDNDVDVDDDDDDESSYRPFHSEVSIVDYDYEHNDWTQVVKKGMEIVNIFELSR